MIGCGGNAVRDSEYVVVVDANGSECSGNGGSGGRGMHCCGGSTAQQQQQQP